MRSTTPVSTLSSPAHLSGWRWYICGLLFLATTICYIDRTTVAVLGDTLKKDLGINDAGYGWVNFAFSAAYALMYTVAGRVIDRVGVRTGFAVAVIFWSLAAMGHAFAAGLIGLCIARFLLGVGEAANFPASIRTVTEWFPRHERAFATGIFNSGSNVGVMLSFVTVWIAYVTHWQWAFLLTGALGLVWAVLWLMTYRTPSIFGGVR